MAPRDSTLRRNGDLRDVSAGALHGNPQNKAVTVRLLWVSLCLAALLLSVAVAVFVVSHFAERDGDQIRQDAVPGSIGAYGIRRNVGLDFRNTLLLSITSNPNLSGNYRARIHAAENAIREEVRLRAQYARNQGHVDLNLLASFQASYVRYVESRNVVLRLAESGDHQGAAVLVETELAKHYEELGDNCSKLVSLYENNIERLSGQIARRLLHLRWTVAAIVVIALIGLSVPFLNYRTRIAEAQLVSRQLERFALAARFAKLVLFVRNLETDEMEWSNHIDEMLDYPAAGMAPRRVAAWRELIHPDDVAWVMTETNNAVRGLLPYEIEYRVRKYSGDFIWLRSCGQISSDGTTVYGMMRDITAARTAEQNSEKLEAQLRQSQKLEAIGTLAGGIAHDFNNILTGIMGNTELLGMDIAKHGHAPLYAAKVATVLKAGERATELTRQILTFSRRSERTRHPMQLLGVCEEAAKLIRSTAPANIEIVENYTSDAPFVLGDPTQIHQVLMNLCTNAIHAMKGRNGRIEIKVDVVNADLEFLKTHSELRPGRQVRLSLIDNGCGMDEKTMKRIFEPFFTTKKAGEGTGLGLSVCHGIIKDHGGSVYCYSHVGDGTTFHVYLPAIITAEAKREDDAEETIRGNGEHILLIDDQQDLREVAEGILTRLGYKVTTFGDPVEAVSWFSESSERPQLVLTDLSMPHLTGLRLARAIQKTDKHIPIILMTGFAGNYTSEALSEIGIQGLLLKPLTIENLSRAVSRGLQPRSVESGGIAAK